LGVELAHQEDLGAAAGYGVGHHFFGPAFAIHLGGVDQRQAQVQAQAQGGGLAPAAGGVFAHIPGSLPQRGDGNSGRQV
jgi:hypothetical protein